MKKQEDDDSGEKDKDSSSSSSSSVHPLLITLYAMVGIFVVVVIACLFAYRIRSADNSTVVHVRSQIMSTRNKPSLTDVLAVYDHAELGYDGKKYGAEQVRLAFNNMKRTLAEKGALSDHARAGICSKYKLDTDMCKLLEKNARIDYKNESTGAPSSKSEQNGSAQALLDKSDMVYFIADGQKYDVSKARDAFFEMATKILDTGSVDMADATEICERYGLGQGACHKLRSHVLSDYEYDPDELRHFTTVYSNHF